MGARADLSYSRTVGPRCSSKRDRAIGIHCDMGAMQTVTTIDVAAGVGRRIEATQWITR